MGTIFETFCPKNKIISEYVDYYYLDIKPDNDLTEFCCFPHYNNSISLYKSHKRLNNEMTAFNPQSGPLQIFTPIREDVLTIKQKGPVYRIVIVFKPLGIYQFYKEHNFIQLTTDYHFFSESEIRELFSTTDTDHLANLIDHFLLNRYEKYTNDIVEKAIEYIFNHTDDFSLEQLAQTIQASRRHINRLFKQRLGITVKRFQEIVLFRKVIQDRILEDTDDNFTRLAHKFNFSDQSHLNKTFKKFTLNSPVHFFQNGTLLGSKDTFWHIFK